MAILLCVEKDGLKIIAAADCTGMVYGSFYEYDRICLLNEIVLERNITEPAEILSALRYQVIKALKQTEPKRRETEWTLP